MNSLLKMTRAGKAINVLGAILGVLLFSFSLFSQVNTGTISGFVQDSSGAVIAGATVTVRNVDTGTARTVTSDDGGNYRVLSLAIGRYEVRVESGGFRAMVHTGINLVVGQEAVVNLRLEVGQLQQDVTVTEEAPIVNTTTASISGLVGEKQVKDLPLNGRSFDNLITLNPGAVNYSALKSGPSVGSGEGAYFTVAGRRPLDNLFLMNGIEYTGSSNIGITPGGVSGQLLGIDAVREFNVMTDAYSAEYGKRAGAQVSVVTQSGTNALHGSLFEFLRNSALDARNFFDQGAAPPFRRNQFGGAAGGPIKKDKLFVFGNYEGFRQRLAVSNVSIVPDAQMRQGLLPCYLATPAGCGSNPGQYVTVPNLKAGMLPYASNFWPSPNGNELIVPAGLPNAGLPTGTAYAIGNPRQSIREDFGMTRFDYNASNKESFSVNYLIDDGEKTAPRANANFNQISRARSQVLSLQETHVFSPTLLNTLNGGFTRAYAPVVTSPAVPIPANLAFITGRLPGQITIGGGVSTTAASAVVVANGNDPTANALNLFTGSDDLHLTKGRHSFSLGAWLQRVQENQRGPAQNKSGTVAYPTLLALLQDSPTAFNANVVVTPLGYRQWEGAWYVQDEMKLKSNLTLRLGLRDEMTNGWNEVAGRCTNYFFDPNGVIQT